LLDNILEKIETLPSLPRTIKRIEKFRKEDNNDAEELIQILEEDALVVTTLLRIANSSFFGFRTKIETVSRLVNLLGISFIVYIAISETINSFLKTDLKPYNIESEDFMKASNGALYLTNIWIPKLDNKLKEDLLLAAFLQEIGKFIISELIINHGLVDEFTKKIESGMDISMVEKELLNTTTSQVTAEIFKHWEFDNNLIKSIENVDNIDNCDEEYLIRTQFLDVIKTVCNVSSYLSESSIEKALNKAKIYNMNLDLLIESIDTLKNRELRLCRIA
jgi:HD-like signal output (HDOD) protein